MKLGPIISVYILCCCISESVRCNTGPNTRKSVTWWWNAASQRSEHHVTLDQNCIINIILCSADYINNCTRLVIDRNAIGLAIVNSDILQWRWRLKGQRRVVINLWLSRPVPACDGCYLTAENESAFSTLLLQRWSNLNKLKIPDHTIRYRDCTQKLTGPASLV